MLIIKIWNIRKLNGKYVKKIENIQKIENS